MFYLGGSSVPPPLLCSYCFIGQTGYTIGRSLGRTRQQCDPLSTLGTSFGDSFFHPVPRFFDSRSQTFHQHFEVPALQPVALELELCSTSVYFTNHGPGNLDSLSMSLSHPPSFDLPAEVRDPWPLDLGHWCCSSDMEFPTTQLGLTVRHRGVLHCLQHPCSKHQAGHTCNKGRDIR